RRILRHVLGSVLPIFKLTFSFARWEFARRGDSERARPQWASPALPPIGLLRRDWLASLILLVSSLRSKAAALQTRMDPVGDVLPQFSVGLDESLDLGHGQFETLVGERRQRLEWIAQKLLAQFFVREQS